MNIVEIPEHVIAVIFSYLSYDEVSRLREICKFFDSVCKGLLNKGFRTVDRKVASYHAKLRAQLPRRESERRLHPLNRLCETLSAVETRLSLMKMSIMRYVDSGLCCFFPGKVLDEVEHVCRVLRTSTGPIKPVDVLHELRDISSMAMDYFDDVIVPSLKSRSKLNDTWFSHYSSFSCDSEFLPSHPIPTNELKMVSTFRQKHMIHLARPSSHFNSKRSQHTGVKADYSPEIFQSLKRLQQGYSLNIRRICSLRCAIHRLRIKQKELTEYNRRLNELVSAQNQRIQQLENICGLKTENNLSFSQDSLNSTQSSSLTDFDYSFKTKRRRNDSSLENNPDYTSLKK